MIQVESDYNPYAVSPKGARGIMQLIPSTARRFGVASSFDAKENITAGVKYLKFLQETFTGGYRLALAAYNAGEGAVMKYRDIPPYPETEQYVWKVGKKLGDARRKAPAASATAAVKAEAPAAPPVNESGDIHGRGGPRVFEDTLGAASGLAPFYRAAALFSPGRGSGRRTGPRHFDPLLEPQRRHTYRHRNLERSEIPHRADRSARAVAD